MQLLVGTSGYSFAPWKGRFYPADLPASRMLAFYAGRFATVEINASFYRMPAAKTLAAWRDEVPPGFRFALKAPRQITHLRRLKDVAQPVAFLQANLAALGGALGPVLYQLPPNLKKDAGRLRDLLALHPADRLAALEVRHESWHDDEVRQLLADHGVALCHAETGDDDPPLVATARWGYLRLRKPEYDDESLSSWLATIAAKGWDSTYIYFKHEDEARGPALAARLLALAGVSS